MPPSVYVLCKCRCFNSFAPEQKHEKLKCFAAFSQFLKFRRAHTEECGGTGQMKSDSTHSLILHHPVFGGYC